MFLALNYEIRETNQNHKPDKQKISMLLSTTTREDALKHHFIPFSG